MLKDHPELSECSYCGEIDETKNMNLLTENNEEKKMCQDCAEEMGGYCGRNSVVSETH